MTSIPFHARKAVVKIAADITIPAADSFEPAFSGGTAIEGYMKDVSITPPEGAVEMEAMLGEGTSGHQHAMFNESAYEPAEVSGTLVVPEEDLLHEMVYGAGDSAGTHTQWRPGDGSRPTDYAVLVKLDNGVDEYEILLNNVVANFGDVSLTGADGHFEVEFTATCLPVDYYERYKESA